MSKFSGNISTCPYNFARICKNLKVKSVYHTQNASRANCQKALFARFLHISGERRGDLMALAGLVQCPSII